MSSSRDRFACSNTRSRDVQTNAVIIAEINAAIRVSSASIGARGVPNREKRAWCANIELGGSKGLRGSPSLPLLSHSLFLSFFLFPSRIGCVPSVTGARIPSALARKYSRSCRYTCAITEYLGYRGCPSKYRLGVEARGTH